MGLYLDRYESFRVGNGIKPIPNVTIPPSDSDKTTIYRLGLTRLDKLSNLYYNNPYSGWLIMLANPEFGGLEFNIPDNSTIRIPFPYNSAAERYITQIRNHIELYGE